MRARLRGVWLHANASYWFWPAIFSLLAVALAMATIALDRAGVAADLEALDWVNPASPDAARNLLNVIAGSMIGVASTVFSITITAVVYASGSYGPRLLNNFMNDRGNQLSLATFIATFVYAVLVLRVVRNPDEAPANLADAMATAGSGFVPQLSLIVATLLMALAVAMLVFFLNHIPASIRINTVLEGIGERLLRDIDQRFPIDGEPDDPARAECGAAVNAEGCGYVQLIDFARLDRIARAGGLRLFLCLRTGDFVHPDVPLLRVDGAAPDAATARALRACFALGGMRTPEQNLEFLIDELVEIGLRALSPAINDPFTAVNALHWLGAATAQIARRDLFNGPDCGDYDLARVVPVADDFEHFLDRGFGSMRASVATSPIALCHFFDGLHNVATATVSRQRRQLLLAEGDRLIEQAETALAGPALAEAAARHAVFMSRVSALCGGAGAGSGSAASAP